MTKPKKSKQRLIRVQDKIYWQGYDRGHEEMEAYYESTNLNEGLLEKNKDLLEACKFSLDMHNREHPKCTTCFGYKLLTQAIAKAEGQ